MCIIKIAIEMRHVFLLPGALQAALGAAEALCVLFSTVLLQGVYYATLTTFRGSVYMLMASLYLCAAICMRYVLRIS